MYSKNDYIYIRTNYRGFIGPLMQSGPIVNPLMCKISDVVQLIMGGMSIQQYDPKSKQSIILTMDNVWDDTKFTKKDIEKDLGLSNTVTPTVITGTPKIETPVVGEPKVEETPVEDPVTDVPPTEDKETIEVENTSTPDSVVEETADETPSADINTQQHLTKSQRKALRREQQKQNNAMNSSAPVTTQTSENKE